LARRIKLFFNLILSGVLFAYFILILILLLNPYIHLGNDEFFRLFRHLVFFYGPLWSFILGIIFFIIQFFAEKKYPIGIISPPTLTYFLSFTILLVSIIFYLNYDYYYLFFYPLLKAKFIKLLLAKLLLIIIAIIFVFFKRIEKKWSQFAFLALLALDIFVSYNTVLSNGHIYQEIKQPVAIPRKIPFFWNTDLLVRPGQDPTQENLPPAPPPQRKIRIVIMDGLSLNLIQTLSSEEKLLNFRLLSNQGVRGKVITFIPNLDLSLINSALTGLYPSQFTFHSSHRYKFIESGHEFDIFPRYIFFRNSSILDITSFYKKDNHIVDHIDKYYEKNSYKTSSLLESYPVPRYSRKSLARNSAFVLRFSEILKKDDPKYTILKKAFFLDDHLKNIIPNLKDSDKCYAVTHFPGLGIISKYFYQYHDPDQLFSSIPETDIKKYGLIIEKYYDYYDSIIGNLMSTTGDNELLVILSFFEYEPLPVWRRILVNLYGENDVYVYKSLQSQGTIFLYEKNALKQGYPLKSISIFDIFPTLVYYAGFQLSRDLEGGVIKEIFSEEFQLKNPIDINTEYPGKLDR